MSHYSFQEKIPFFFWEEGGVSFYGGGEFVTAEGRYQGTGEMNRIKMDDVKDTKNKIFFKKLTKKRKTAKTDYPDGRHYGWRAEATVHAGIQASCEEGMVDVKRQEPET